ncbi:response regulator [uncultured Anaerotruncus sp.]|uniref:response regulator n=1 Tax=uncultured Anaerotruncus sp. TaxID=905011 RepID=UPI00280AB461|nr:response regulator [uncultured Anaerotruncus sp.]
MRYLAVDDEAFALDDLEEALREVDPEYKLARFTMPSEALDYAACAPVNVAFLDVELGSTSGLVLAKKLKDLRPRTSIIFVTAHEQYALGAIRLHATGYLLKPVTADDIRRELTFLYEEGRMQKKVRVKTFGGFDVYVDGRPLTFHRSKTKELLAYLVDRRGASVTSGEACAVLWEEKSAGPVQKSYLRTVTSDLRATLRDAGVEEILVKGHDWLAIVPSRLDCDSYRFLEGDPQAVNSYRRDYMICYSWAEFSMGIHETEQRN